MFIFRRWRMQFMMYQLRVMLVTLIVLSFLTLVPSTALAQTTPVPVQNQDTVQLQVTAGFDGMYRVGYWFPIHVIISNDGPDIRGILEWHYPQHSTPHIHTFQREIDLPRGAQKRLTLYAYTTNWERSAEIRLLNGRQVVKQQTVRLEPIDSSQFVAGIISSDTTLLNSLTTLKPGQAEGTTIVRLTPEYLPENPLVLASIDTLFIHDSPPTDFRPTQITALDQWVYLGGQLVLSGGVNGEGTTTTFATLSPVTVQGLVGDAPLTALQELVGNNRHRQTLPASATVSRFDLKPGAQALDQDRLIITQPVGTGKVIFSAFDLSTLRAWSGEPVLWNRVLQFKPRFDLAIKHRLQWMSLLRDVLQLQVLQLPSFGILLLFICTYIVLVGPVNFLVLRRLQRAEWAWGSIPLIVLLFVASTYGVSVLTRGTRYQAMQVAVVQSFEQQAQGQAAAFIGIYSPHRASYTLNFPQEVLISRENLFVDQNQSIAVTWSDTDTTIYDMLVDVSALRTLIAEQVVAVPFQVRSNLDVQQGKVVGTIENIGNQPITDALLVYGFTIQNFDRLQPGEQQTVSLVRGKPNTLDSVEDSSEAFFNRQRMLDILFQPQQHGFGIPDMGPDLNGVYLLIWSEQPLIELQVDGNQASQQGLTLYMIRLDK